MPVRSQEKIRRDINRLKDLIEREKNNHPSLNAILPKVSSACNDVNKTWQQYQGLSTKESKEIEERDKSIWKIKKWIQKWRPVLLIIIKGADKNLENLPSRGTTHDDTIRVAEDMAKLINENKEAASFKEFAINELGNKLENAKKELEDSTEVKPEKSNIRKKYSKNCRLANDILVKALLTVKAIFGRTSPEYKQFITKSTNKE